MSENANISMVRTCEWCAESIPQQALICPYCRTWRKDIYKARAQAYNFGLAALFLCLTVFISSVVTHELPFILFSAILFVGGIICACFYLRYYLEVSKKIGSWWWI